MSVNSLVFYPVGNGDTSLLRFGSFLVLTDVNYRVTTSEDDPDPYDLATDLRKETERKDGRRVLDVFVLTHPDADHVRGSDTLFHFGHPDKFPKATADADRPILLNEIWVSPYTVNGAYETDESAALLKEIRRRHKLQGTPEASRDGNRLRVLDSDSYSSELTLTSCPHVRYRVLAPNSEEANIEQSDDADERVSCNNTSLVIRWTIFADSQPNHVLLAGDAGVEVWERLESDHGATDGLDWNILLTPHHCSRSAISYRDNASGDYEDSETALAALAHKASPDAAFAIASSREFDPSGENTPPHQYAKDKYLEILGLDAKTDAAARFCQPEIHDDGEDQPVRFEFTAKGPALINTRKKEPVVEALGAFSQGGRYG